MYLAAETHVDRPIQDPAVFTETNIMGTQNLLDAALKNGVKRFIHVSTDEVYGELELKKKLLKETIEWYSRYQPLFKT